MLKGQTDAAGGAPSTGDRRANPALWIFALLFFCVGVALTAASLKSGLQDIEWLNARKTPGRVLLTSWESVDGQSRLKISYAYEDEERVIYHATGTLAARRGRLSLEPGASVLVFYKPDNHERSRLCIELGFDRWVPVLVLGMVELAAAGIFALSAVRKARGISAAS